MEVPLAGSYITEAPAGLNAFLYPLHYLIFLALGSLWVLKQFPLFSYFFLFPLPPWMWKCTPTCWWKRMLSLPTLSNYLHQGGLLMAISENFWHIAEFLRNWLLGGKKCWKLNFTSLFVSHITRIPLFPFPTLCFSCMHNCNTPFPFHLCFSFHLTVFLP